jgi:hypothetical protein
MKNTVYLEHLQAKAPVDNIMYRMGYKKNMTQISGDQQKSIDEGIKLGELLCELKGAYEIVAIKSIKSGVTSIKNNINFESKQTSELFKDCEEVILFASTAGQKILDRRDFEIKNGNAALGVILDAVGSETADTGLDWIQQFLSAQLAKKAKSITRRFSPGYGDLKLAHQKDIYDALHLEKIGISITDRYLLSPEKSVIAIAGVY